MQAFVLSGGSIKGAFQAGALARVLRAGFRPALISGISVGALNGVFLADRTGRMGTSMDDVDWDGLADRLVNFWRTRITKPSQLVRRRSATRLANDILTNDFRGVVDTSPLKGLIRDEVDVANVLASPIRLQTGAVNMSNTRIRYTDTGDAAYRAAGLPDFLDFILASTAIPIAMPSVKIDGDRYFDGGLRDIAPVGHAINSGATEIVAITCQPRGNVRVNDEIDLGNLITLIGRLEETVTSEILENDLAVLDLVNRAVGALNALQAIGDAAGFPFDRAADEIKALAGLAGYKRLMEPLLITPLNHIAVGIESFKKADIERMLRLGDEAAERALDGRTWP